MRRVERKACPTTEFASGEAEQPFVLGMSPTTIGGVNIHFT